MLDAQKRSSGQLQLICFKLGQEEFGVDILKVREIVPFQTIAHLPQTPESVAGIINLRGNLIPVIHLRKKFGLDSVKNDDKTRIIIFSIAEKLIGMIVDRVERVFRTTKDHIEPPPDVGVGEIQDYVVGMTKADSSLIIVIDIEKILTDEEMLRMEDLKKMKQAFEQEGGDKTSDEDESEDVPAKTRIKKPAKRQGKKRTPK